VVIFGIVILFAMFGLRLWCKNDQDVQHLKDILALILGPTVALVGSAMGFYFATKSASDDTSDRA
jgi:predicted esterase YcpF (UPF0227 family)